jgi:hypothetical protein
MDTIISIFVIPEVGSPSDNTYIYSHSRSESERKRKGGEKG